MKAEKEMIDKYIKAMYTQESSLNSIEDLKIRKERAAVKAGFSLDDELIIEIMKGNVDSVNKSIFTFLRKSASNRYLKLVGDQNLYWRMSEKLILLQDSEEDDALSKANKLSKELDDLLDRITRNYREIFHHNEQVVMVAEKTIRMITPEERLKGKSA